ncbi:gp58-like family protein [Latilactobacillus curvatus]|uniref:gp58-like family protein n=1 Tax=Latilactobacillus curvatus TaxID=28038 RepID=UPI000978B3A5|nr:gp58-like family protein [Latilactobacillus curvatus]
MLKASDAFNSAFAAPDRELHARVTIGKTVYDSDDLTSINYDSGAMTGEQFSIGSTYMNSTKITFSHLVEGLKQLDEVLVEFGVLKPDGAVEYVKMGTFIVDDKIQMDRNNNTTTIECMDRMTMLGGAYVSKLTYPARIKDVAVEIANMAGVKANETSFARLSENKINQPTGYTYRDAIGLIAQFQMGFALFDRDGLLDIRTLQDNSFKIDPNQYFLKGLVKNETFFKLNGISCTVVTASKDENGNETSKTTVLQSGSSSGAQIKLANNVMTQDVLDRMYEALKFTNYYPFSLNWNGNPAVEAGDWLTVEDLQGNEFKVPNMSYTLTYNGGLTATSKADTSVSSPATYSYGGTISNIVNEIGGRESAEGNHIYEGTEDQEPTLSKEGDLWYKHVGPDTEERIYKDGKWEFLTSTKTANDAADAADKASKEAEEAKKQANESVAAANDAVAKAGFANETATQAKSDAAAAGQQAKDALTDAKKALTDSGSAIKDAADSLTSAKDALNKVGTLTTSVTSQFTTVDNELKSKVNQTDYDKLKGTVTSQQTEINQNASGIKLKADTTALNELKGTVDKQGSEITLNTNSIKLKADQSSVDTLKGTVDKQGSAIDVNTKAIALKASQSTVDTLTGRVSTAEGKITVQADQILQTVSKTELTSKLNGYATQTWSQGQISAAKNEITASVETVKQTVNNMVIGGRNYFSVSGFIANKYTNDGTIDFYDLKLLPNTKYIVSTNKTVNNLGYADIFAGRKGLVPSTPSNGVTAGQSQIILTDTTGVLTIAARSYSIADGKDKIQVELGAVATTWQPAPEDLATVDWAKSQLAVTDGKITASVSSLKSDITSATNALNNNITTATAGMATQTWTQGQINTTADNINLSVSKVQTDLGGTKTQFAALEVKVDGIQTTVSGKADQSQVTQLANQITSVVTDVEQIGNEGRNYFHNSNFARDLDSWGIDKAGSTNPSIVRSGYYKLGYKIGLHMFGTSNVPYNGFWQQTSMYGAAGDNVVLSFIAAQDGNYDSMLHIGLTFYKDSQNVGSTAFDMQTKNFNNSSGSRENHVFKAPAEFNEVSVRLAPTANIPINVWLTNLKLESNALTPYTEAPEDRATQSQITQLTNDINLRVQKGDVVNQINISPEGILIDGKKVHITGLTRIDNAVIKDAMIADIKADKITAGTLNAANVNVINLNANNITTGTIKGANLSMNLNTGEVLFQKGSIKSANGNLNLDISKGTMAVINEDKSGFYFEDGKLVLNDGWLEGTSSQPKYGSLEYNANYFTVNGLAVKGTEGVTIGTPGYNPSMEMMFSSVKESGIAIDRKHLEMGSVGPTVISSGNEFFMNLLTKQPFIAVGTTADGNFMTTDKPGSRISLYAEYVHIKSAYLKTASGSANVIVAADGALVRSTSASKYKTDIIRTNIPDYGEKLLELPTATWTDIAETKRYQDNPTTQPKPTRNFGMIAEDLADAGLEMLVVRGTDGELEGINYDRIGPALIPVIAKLKNEVEILRQKIGGKSA